jgi:hypothetical protein
LANVQVPGCANLPQGSLPRPRKPTQELEASLAMFSRQKGLRQRTVQEVYGAITEIREEY